MAADPAPAPDPFGAPAPRRFLDLPGFPRIAYAEAGAGPPLILVHGALVTLDDMWLGPMAALARHFRVVAIDRPGHGESGHGRPADASLWRQADLVLAVADALSLERPVVAGHSFGGAVALACGLAAPERIRGVVAIAPIAFPEPRLEQVLFGPRAVPVVGPPLSRALAPADAVLLPLLWRALFLPRAMPETFARRFPFASRAGRTGWSRTARTPTCSGPTSPAARRSTRSAGRRSTSCRAAATSSPTRRCTGAAPPC